MTSTGSRGIVAAASRPAPHPPSACVSAGKVDLALRLGWLHELANVARPITAAFAGAPGNSFTVFGATPLRNSAVVGLQATTNIAAAMQIYLRYDGEIEARILLPSRA